MNLFDFVKNTLEEKIRPTAYSLEGNGIPEDLYWKGNLFRRSDGTSHCSGAIFYAVVEFLREHSDLELNEFFTESLLREMMAYAWIYDNYPKEGLPLFLSEILSLGTLRSDIPPQKGDVVQVWRKNKTGHLIICAGYDQEGYLLEWSSSSRNQRGIETSHFKGEIEQAHCFTFDMNLPCFQTRKR